MSDSEAGIPVAEFKRNFSRYISAAENGETVVVTRHGRPVGQFGPPTTVRASGLPVARKPGGVLAVLGLFNDWTDMEKDMAEVVAERRKAKDRPAPTFD
jgi:hypothetical protein